MRVDLKWSNFNSERMELLIWQRWFCSVGTGQPLLCWSNTLKSAFSHSRIIIILKIWCQCLLFVQSYLENFLCHQAAAVPVLPTDNLSPVCRYITEIWPVLMACTWKNRVLLAAFWVKISIFHLGHWHQNDQLWIRALTSARAFAAATCRARPRARRRRSLNILTAREPMGPSSRRRLILLASHCMALARERKKPSRIAREIEIFSIFAGWVPTLVPKHNSRFRIFSSSHCWSWWSINIYKTFGRKKIAVSLWNLVSVPCSETGPNLRTSIFVDRWL